MSTSSTDQPERPSEPLNLARACLGRWAEDPATADRPAFTFVEADDTRHTWTYAEAWAAVRRVGHALLARELVPGDRVLVRMPHSPAYAFAFFGANAAGLVPIPASPQLTEEEARFLLDDSGAAAVIAPPALALAGAHVAIDAGTVEAVAADRAAPADGLRETSAEDPAFLIYTSGTTARPKGVLHAQRAVLARASVRDGWHGLGRDDVTLHAGTLNWSYTLVVGLMDPWLAGAHAVLAGGANDPQRWPALIERLHVTVFASVPTIFRQMLKYARPEDRDFSALRHVLCAGEPLTPALLDEWRTRAGTEMFECLGMTEVSTYISSGPVTPVRVGSPGRPQLGRRVAILPIEGDSTSPLPAGEVGLLAVHRSDPGLMLGYWRRPDEEQLVFRGEWFIGGDLAAIDADGYVWFHGRADDTIKSFGYRLSPTEIEAALGSAPGVSEAAVVGFAVEAQKTIVVAYVVAQPGATLDEQALRAHAQAHLASYKQPHEYRFVETLPRTRNGKLLRRALPSGG
ncbi:MAG: acyl-CoA synthetase [Chloroflexi bacterium]|nr:acyl-CoA synthetase [Chloroflexota bacterium]